MQPTKYINLFKNKNFIALWSGQIISEFGDRFAQMALLASLYYGIQKGTPQSGGMLQLAILLTVMVIPVFVVGPVAGVYVDRWDRKNTMIVCDLLRGLLIFAIPFLLIQLKMIFLTYFVVFLIFSITRFFLPAKLGIIPDIVPEKDLLLANSLIVTSTLAAMVCGLGVGSIIIDLVGIKMGFYIDGITYFISALAIMLVKTHKQKTTTRESLLTHEKRIKEIEKNVLYDIINSIRYIFHHSHIPFILRTFFILMSGIGAIYLIFIDFILQHLTVPTQIGRIIGFGQFGFIIVALGTGAFIGTILFGKWGQKIAKEKAILIGFILTGISLSSFAYFTYLYNNFWLTIILAVIMGIAAAPIMVLSYTLLHEVTTDKMRGRVFTTVEIVIHIAFIIFMYLSMILVSFFKVHPVHILGIAGILAFLYGTFNLFIKKINSYT